MLKPTKQTVYLPVKVEDVIEKNEGWCIAFVNKEGYQYGRFNKSDKPKFKSNIDGKIKNAEQGFLLPQEGYFFTPEQLNQFLSDVIKDTLNTAAEKAEVIMKQNCDDHTPYWGSCLTCGRIDNPDVPTEDVNKESITNTFEETFNKFKA